MNVNGYEELKVPFWDFDPLEHKPVTRKRKPKPGPYVFVYMSPFRKANLKGCTGLLSNQLRHWAEFKVGTLVWNVQATHPLFGPSKACSRFFR